MLSGIAAMATLTLAGVSPASASTLNAVATIANATTDAPLASGASKTPFTVTLPPNAACSGDTASDGFHVYSYLVPKGTAVSSITFTEDPSTGYGFVNNIGTYYGAANTAATTGQVISIPNNFQWAPLVSDDGVAVSQLVNSGTTPGVWEGGIACANSSGVLTDNWNTQITFKASSTDPTGFVWSDVPGYGREQGPGRHVGQPDLGPDLGRNHRDHHRDRVHRGHQGGVRHHRRHQLHGGVRHRDHRRLTGRHGGPQNIGSPRPRAPARWWPPMTSPTPRPSPLSPASARPRARRPGAPP